MSKKISFIGFGVLAIGISIIIFQLNQTQKIAYVQAEYLLTNYSGTIQAQNIFSKKVEQWTENSKVLKEEFDSDYEAYHKDASRLDDPQKESALVELEAKRANYQEYRNAIAEKSQEEEAKLMEGILVQVNQFIEDYARFNDYDMIIGSNSNGNVAYGTEQLDITDEVLEFINTKYASNE